MKLKYITLSFLIINIQLSYAVDPSDAAIMLAKKKGNAVYTSCVLTPPVTKPQITYCETIYNVYKAALSAVAAPTPISINPNPSMTSYSPYDPCRYDAAVFVYTNPTSIPYCPSL